MSESRAARDSNYGTPSKVLAAVLSPWVIILLALAVLAILYRLYYKPRLHHGYRSFPNPQIFFLPPHFRRRKFRDDPLAFLNTAERADSSSSLFWTDAITGYNAKTVTVVTDNDLILQFLSSDNRDSLSWDAPLRSAWEFLFENDSTFGESSLWTFSRYCLVNGFSPQRTSMVSPFCHTIEEHTSRILHNFVEGDLCQLVESVVSRSLMQILLGSSLTDRMYDIGQQILTALQAAHTSQSSVRRLTNEFVSLVRRTIDDRLEDVERYADNGDYLQWVIKIHGSSELQTEVSGSPKFPASEASGPSSNDSTADSPAGARKDCEKERTHRLKRAIPDHILVTFLQTHLLVKSCVIWATYSNLTMGNQTSPDPLLLVRKSRKETLLGSTIIPKDCYVAISPVLQKMESDTRHSSGVTEYKRTRSTTELSTLSAFNSVVDLDDLSHDRPTFNFHDSPSTGSFSALLRDTRTTNTSSNNLSEMGSKTNLESLHKNRTGAWVRRYPQGHLISLITGSVTDRFKRSLALLDGSPIKPEYGPAKLLWLPFPSLQIRVTKTLA